MRKPGCGGFAVISSADKLESASEIEASMGAIAPRCAVMRSRSFSIGQAIERRREVAIVSLAKFSSVRSSAYPSSALASLENSSHDWDCPMPMHDRTVAELCWSPVQHIKDLQRACALGVSWTKVDAGPGPSPIYFGVETRPMPLQRIVPRAPLHLSCVPAVVAREWRLYEGRSMCVAQQRDLSRIRRPQSLRTR